ncbi:sigma-54-dependent transcriptional regulator [Pandoraea oxalativorans]|uniref:Sigma-54-dependent Fis family transcriptional regulator n=1 Tax=Pandoraea oxalativorans TaxID=573737 RepID=A0A0E3U7W7_9BURK|nr:sigma-54 dependent transcriptional regulator [Pandoraea oxalativorans]AKC70793.1 sigma-54-dependent Fis family transcriptional regulator [Pandoraea oxalativorans]
MPYILIVEDDADTRDMLRALVQSQQLHCDAVSTLGEARERSAARVPDLVLTDLVLPDGSGMDLLSEFPQAASVEVVLMTGHASLETAIDALRRGAADYLVKPINVQRLNGIIARVPRTDELRGEILTLRAQLQELGRFGRMLGNSPPMKEVYRSIGRVAPSEASVFLMGESGTGKELAAQTVHDLSLRRKGPFVAINCGAIAANLVESEMFGHDRGSFTGADRQHKGFFERADGGTLFLDEVTEMPPESQVKLLRVLETGKLMRLGSTQEINVDVRIIAATNINPEAAVADGRFRLDLYHRLNVFPITLPPLRERGGDIQMLAKSFLTSLSETDGRPMWFSDETLDALSTYDWPGNVRELRNLVHRAHILNDGDVIETLPQPILAELDDAMVNDDSVTVPLDTPLEEMDRKLILGTLERCGGVKARAAEMLNISLKTLYSRLAEPVEKDDGPAPRHR